MAARAGDVPGRHAPLPLQYEYWDKVSRQRTLTLQESVKFERIIGDLDRQMARKGG